MFKSNINTTYAESYSSINSNLIKLAELYPDKKSFEVANGIGLFDKVCGTDYVRKEFVKRYKVADVIEYWRKDEEEFREMSRQYHIY